MKKLLILSTLFIIGCNPNSDEDETDCLMYAENNCYVRAPGYIPDCPDLTCENGSVELWCECYSIEETTSLDLSPYSGICKAFLLLQLSIDHLLLINLLQDSL